MHVHPRGLHYSKEDLQSMGESYDMRTKHLFAADLVNSNNAVINVTPEHKRSPRRRCKGDSGNLPLLPAWRVGILCLTLRHRNV